MDEIRQQANILLLQNAKIILDDLFKIEIFGT
jgi:hypothetical protein